MLQKLNLKYPEIGQPMPQTLHTEKVSECPESSKQGMIEDFVQEIAMKDKLILELKSQVD